MFLTDFEKMFTYFSVPFSALLLLVGQQEREQTTGPKGHRVRV